MTKKEVAEIKGILSDINKRVTEIGANQKISNAKVDSWDDDFKKIKRAVTNVEVVTGETARRVEQLHTNMIETASKIGSRVRKLELVKDTPSGGRRPAKKN